MLRLRQPHPGFMSQCSSEYLLLVPTCLCLFSLSFLSLLLVSAYLMPFIPFILERRLGKEGKGLGYLFLGTGRKWKISLFSSFLFFYIFSFLSFFTFFLSWTLKDNPKVNLISHPLGLVLLGNWEEGNISCILWGTICFVLVIL